MIRHRDVGKSQWDSHLLSSPLLSSPLLSSPTYSTAFLNFLCVNLHIYSVPLCMHPIREWLSSLPTGGSDCNRLDYFLCLSLLLSFLLYLTHTLPLSFLLSVSPFSGSNAPSPLICSRNEDGEFQRESFSSADARCPTPALPQCSLVPSLLPSLSRFLVLLPFTLPQTLFSHFSLPVSLICEPPSPSLHV